MPTRNIVFTDMPGVTRIYVIREETKNLPIGRCLVIFNNKAAILWDIYIDPEYRKQGYASDMLAVIKKEFDEIKTDYITKEGKNLCLKNGFIKNNQNYLRLIWRKEELNASQDNKN